MKKKLILLTATLSLACALGGACGKTTTEPEISLSEAVCVVYGNPITSSTSGSRSSDQEEITKAFDFVKGVSFVSKEAFSDGDAFESFASDCYSIEFFNEENDSLAAYYYSTDGKVNLCYEGYLYTSETGAVDSDRIIRYSAELAERQ